MRYRQPNPSEVSGSQRAKTLINSNDALSTKEQEEVITYFADSLRQSTLFLKVVVALHAVLALVYVTLAANGSVLLELNLDEDTTANLLLLAQQQAAPMGKPSSVATPASVAAAALSTTQDPFKMLAALDAQQRVANRNVVHHYLQRKSGGFSNNSSGSANGLVRLLSLVMMFYSAGLLLWAAWSGYKTCRRLRINVEDLTSLEARELGSSPVNTSLNGTSVTIAAAAASVASPTGGRVGSRLSMLRRLRQRLRAEMPVTHYTAAALSTLTSIFWVLALRHRHMAMQQAYVSLGLTPPSLFRGLELSSSVLEYVLALWQPFFHIGIGLLLRSMLDTKENLIALSNMKYRYDKV